MTGSPGTSSRMQTVTLQKGSSPEWPRAPSRGAQGQRRYGGSDQASGLQTSVTCSGRGDEVAEVTTSVTLTSVWPLASWGLFSLETNSQEREPKGSCCPAGGLPLSLHPSQALLGSLPACPPSLPSVLPSHGLCQAPGNRAAWLVRPLTPGRAGRRVLSRSERVGAPSRDPPAPEPVAGLDLALPPWKRWLLPQSPRRGA